MADIKFAGLPASSGIPDNGSVMAISTYDGVSTYTSEKYTMSQLKDTVYVMEAEDKITFDSSGTNKVFMQNSDVGDMTFYNDSSYFAITEDGNGVDFTGSWIYFKKSGEFEVGRNTGAAIRSLKIDDSEITLNTGNTGSIAKMRVNVNGIGFFASAPVAKQTSVPVTAAGIHAALVAYGLIS